MKLNDLKYYTAEVVHPAWLGRHNKTALTNELIGKLALGLDELLSEKDGWTFPERARMQMLRDATTENSSKSATSETLLSQLHDQLREKISRREAISVENAAKMDNPKHEATVASTPERTSVGQWRLFHELGKGGQGLTFLAERDEPRTQGVVKLLREDRKSPKAFKRFERELKAMSMLTHPCILKVLDASFDGENPWVATEYHQMGSLDTILNITQGDAWRSLRLARDVAVGLGVAHAKGVIHRDIKPANILLKDLDHAVVGDFGIAHIDSATQVTDTNERVLAQWFGPPEANEARVDEPQPNFDVYSLGKLIYVMISGGDRFLREHFKKNDANLSLKFGARLGDPVNLLLDKMIQESPNARFQSMKDVVNAIDETLAILFGHGPNGLCPYCRQGQLKLREDGRIAPGATSGPRANITLSVQICDVCGHIELSEADSRSKWNGTDAV